MDIESVKNDFNIELGRRISSLRKEKGLTQLELGVRCHKDKQSISRLENGRVTPSIFFLLQIATALGISLDELVKFKVPSKIIEYLSNK